MIIVEGNQILLRVFAEVSSDVEASEVGRILSNSVATFGHVTVFNVEKYWKIPNYFEVSLEIRGPNLNNCVCKKIAKVLGNGWVEAGNSLIWNSTVKARFMDSKVKWANLEFIEL